MRSKEAIVHAQETHKRVADKYKRSLACKENDGVLLRFTKARLCHTTNKNKQEEPKGHQKYSMKLSQRYYGPSQSFKG